MICFQKWWTKLIALGNSCRYFLYISTYRNKLARWFGCVFVQLSAGIYQSELPYLPSWEWIMCALWHSSTTQQWTARASRLRTPTQNGICKQNNLSLCSIYYREIDLRLCSSVFNQSLCTSLMCLVITINLEVETLDWSCTYKIVLMKPILPCSKNTI